MKTKEYQKKWRENHKKEISIKAKNAFYIKTLDKVKNVLYNISMKKDK